MGFKHIDVGLVPNSNFQNLKRFVFHYFNLCPWFSSLVGGECYYFVNPFSR